MCLIGVDDRKVVKGGCGQTNNCNWVHLVTQVMYRELSTLMIIISF